MWDDYEPLGAWRFDDGVAARFDNMFQRSIPGYQTMRNCVDLMLAPFLERGARVLEAGCSNALALRRLALENPNCEFLGLDNSPAMVSEARLRTRHLKNVEVKQGDLCALCEPRFDAILIIATLCFIEVSQRGALLSRLRRHLLPGGALIIVEKTSEAGTGQIFRTAAYRRHKLAQGYSRKQIEAKRRSLEGVLVPLSDQQNSELFKGFEVTKFWQALDFVGYFLMPAVYGNKTLS